MTIRLPTLPHRLTTSLNVSQLSFSRYREKMLHSARCRPLRSAKMFNVKIHCLDMNIEHMKCLYAGFFLTIFFLFLFTPGVVNRTQSMFDQPPNQSNLIEYICSIGFQLIEFIERSSNQSNFQKVFVINLMSVQLPLDYIPLLFDYIRFMKILHLPFFFLLLLLFSLNKKYNKKKRNELFPL